MARINESVGLKSRLVFLRVGPMILRARVRASPWNINRSLLSKEGIAPLDDPKPDIAALLTRLKEAVVGERWSDVQSAAEDLWAAGDRRATLSLHGYRAALNASDPENAERWVDLGIAECPPDWRLFRAKGDLHRDRSSWQEARLFYEKAVSQAPDQAIPSALLGAACLRLREFAAAVAGLRRAVELAGEASNPTWLEQLGTAELRLGNIKQARDAFSRAHLARPQPRLSWMLSDLDRRIASGSHSASATMQFYDDVFEHRPEYHSAWRDSAYSPIWEGQVIPLLREKGIKSILDLGCGPGQFADCLAELMPGVDYHGVDFSAVAVEHGRKRRPEFRFTQLELPISSYGGFEPFEAVVCTEVLEHVDEDLAVISPIPAGRFVVMSVPNFDSFGHVRVFESKNAVSARYAYLFVDFRVFPAEHGKNILWVVSGERADH